MREYTLEELAVTNWGGVILEIYFVFTVPAERIFIDKAG